MQEYDAALKRILTGATGSALAQLTGFTVARWHNAELPAVRHRRADLLGETAEGRLVHIELQSTNHPDMALRMLEYSVAIRRKFRRFPRQIVLYVGNGPLRMKRWLKGPGLRYRCRVMDFRELDAEPLLASASLGDNVIGILARLHDERDAVQRILGRIAASPPAERATSLGELFILAGLRRLGPVIEWEIKQMPILDDIMDNEVLGRERKRGIEMGKVEGRVEGAREVVIRQIGKRFGNLPDWAKQRIDTLSGPELESLELRLLDASSIEELFA